VAGKYPLIVTPAKAGVQKVLKRLDSCFRRNDILRSKKIKMALIYPICSFPEITFKKIYFPEVPLLYHKKF
jgi:hypothetical protein